MSVDKYVTAQAATETPRQTEYRLFAEVTRSMLAQKDRKLRDTPFCEAILTGTIPQGKLRALRQALDEQFESIEDPRLSAVLEEIELRAAVELAKLDRLPRSV